MWIVFIDMRYLFPISPWNQQRQFEKAIFAFPAHLAMYATHLRNEDHDVHWDCEASWLVKPTTGVNHSGETVSKLKEMIVIENDFQIDVPFEKLPYPDRIFTDAKNKRWQKYGNYRHHPATHMMVSNLCWYGKCTFCVDTYKLEHGEKRGLRSVDHVMEEIDDLIRLGFKEVFDDSGTFPVGDWLEEFAWKMNDPKYGVRKNKIHIGINMKPIKMDYKLLAYAGVGFTLVGIESANQHTVDTIKKGQKSEDIIPIMKAMNDAGLKVHLTSMFGYEWETHEDAMRTVKLVHYLLKKGYVKTAQASVYSPPRTQPDPKSTGHRYIPMIYEAYRSPEFWYRKVMDLKEWADIKYLIRGGRLVIEEKIRKAFR